MSLVNSWNSLRVRFREREPFFIQQLAEFVNDQRRNAALVVTLHQNFSAYAYGLDGRQREEWEKVKGRLKELTFNEPVEQLLELAANQMNGLAGDFRAQELEHLVEVIDDFARFRTGASCSLSLLVVCCPLIY